MSDEHQHELAILTNDGWVVTLKSDKQIDLGDAIVKSIIVQPVEDYQKRIDNEPNELRREYRLTRSGHAAIT